MNFKNTTMLIAGLLIAVLFYKLFFSEERADIQYERGVSLKDEDPDKSFFWFHKAAEQYLKAAKRGNAEAQCKLGECYLRNRGVMCGLGENYSLSIYSSSKHEDPNVEAAKWYRKAAEQGNAEAQCALGILYFKEIGVELDKTEAAKWYRKAAEQGHVVAQYALGECYSLGDGVEPDKTEAAKWYRKAAESGDANAQYKLGLCYAKGDGIVKNKIEAKKWYSKAAEQKQRLAEDAINGFNLMDQYRKDAENGDAKAQFELGRLYSDCEEVDQDDVEAVKWFTKAAEQGNKDAQWRLGLCYEKGRGVEKDVRLAGYLQGIAQANQVIKWNKEHQ